jgi:heat shock protein HslJ
MIGAVIAGCAAERDAGQATGEKEKTGWTLAAMRLEGAPWSMVSGSTITLSLGDGNTVFGHAGVNRYSGAFVPGEDGRISWPGGIAATKMAGPPELMAQEQAFLTALPLTEVMILEKDGVVLESGDGAVRLSFR